MSLVSFRPRNLRRAGALVAAGLAAATVLTACGSSNNAGTTSSPGSSTGSSTGGSGSSSSDAGIAQAKADIAKAEQPTTTWPAVQKIQNPASLQGKKVMIVPLTDTVAVLNGMATTAQGVMTKLGASVTICDGKANPTTVASCLQQAQDQKYYAVVTLFVAYAMAPTALNSLANSGVHVVIDGDEPKSGQSYPANIQFSNSQANLIAMSKLEAEQALADAGTSANVIIEELTDTADQIAQGQAVLQEMNKLCPSCTAKVLQMTTANADKIPSQVSAALVGDPKATAITLPVDAWMPQTIQGVQSAGRNGKVELISTGGDLDGLQRVKSGQEAADFGSSVVLDGYELVDGVERSIAGEKVQPGIPQTRDFVKSNVQGLNLAASEYNTMDWYGSTGFEQNFMTAWGASS